MMIVYWFNGATYRIFMIEYTDKVPLCFKGEQSWIIPGTMEE